MATASIGRNVTSGRMRHLTAPGHSADTAMSRKPRPVQCSETCPACRLRPQQMTSAGPAFSSPQRQLTDAAMASTPRALLQKPDASQQAVLVSRHWMFTLCSCSSGAMVCPSKAPQGPLWAWCVCFKALVLTRGPVRTMWKFKEIGSIWVVFGGTSMEWDPAPYFLSQVQS